MRKTSKKITGSEKVGQWLVDVHALALSDLSRAVQIAETKKLRPYTVLTSMGLITDLQLAKALQHASGAPLLSVSEISLDESLAHAFNAAFLERSRVVPFRGKEGLVLAMVDPFDEDAIRASEFILKEKVDLAVITPQTFETLFQEVFGRDSDACEESLSQSHGLDERRTVERLEDQASEAPIVRFVNRLVTDAIEARASDIHLEPSAAGLRARIRVDGVLREVAIPQMNGAAVLSRIKVLAGLDIAERRLPQDGRLSLAVRGREVDFRVSTVPLMQGESVVLRILDRTGVELDFSSLGFDRGQVNALEDLLVRPHGILLVTGPTGSGKTTTLYTALSGLASPDKKILTIEDPIEYQLPGIGQSQVNTKIGHGFANALRSFLRQDPDIMMVGEIRDLETAEIAIQASLTGHLVLSTLHTNDAIGAIARLVDLGAEDYLLSNTLAGLVAQRLVRRLCPSCCRPHEEGRGLAEEMLRATPTALGEGAFLQPEGCSECEGTGYRGRLVIAEILPITDVLRTLILKRCDERALLEAARASGFRTMLEDGVLKAAQGLTSLSEVMRATRV